MGIFLRSFGLVAVVLLSGCESDHEASASLPREAIAEGSLYPLWVGDSCSGGGKISFCTSEAVVSIDSINVDDPRIARVFPMEQLAEGFRDASPLVIDARKAGSTTAKIEATFDDDSKRSAEVSIVVKKADQLTLAHGCSADEPGDNELFPAGADVPLTLGLFAGKEALVGEHQREVLAGAGIERKFGGVRSNVYHWMAPMSSGTTKLTSPLFPKFKYEFRTYAPGDVDIDSVTRRYQGEVKYGNGVAFDSVLKVRGKVPCQLPAVTLEVSTPEVCSGPDGATSWAVSFPERNINLKALASGSCAFTVSVDGSSVSRSFDTELEVTDIPVRVVDPCEGVVCEAPPPECEEGSELVKEQCCTTCKALPDPELCALEREPWDALYAREHAKSTQCLRDSDCTVVGLISGCRRYCYVPLSTARIGDFMNTISEDYYTACPDCSAGVAADCTGPSRAICEDDQCVLAPSE